MSDLDLSGRPAPKFTSHKRLGGTAIAALMGEDSFKRTPLDIYNRIVHGTSVPPNRYMARGNAMEQAVRELYVKETSAELEPHPGVVNWRECFAASVDDLRIRESTPGVVDYKTASANSLRKWKDGPLPSYIWQLRLYMEVFSREVSDLYVAFGNDVDAEKEEPGAFFIGDNRYARFDVTETKLYTVTRDPGPAAQMIEAGERFWAEHVVPRIPPPGGVELAPPQRHSSPALSASDLSALDSLESAC